MNDPLKREVKPEILDSLPEDHPEALHNRRDLRLINVLMGNFRWFRRTLPGLLRPGDTGLELGAGDGSLGNRLLRSGTLPPGTNIDGLDLWRRPPDWPDSWGWHREDIQAFSGYDRYSFVLANFILHQFTDDELAEIGARLRRNARFILTCETARRAVHLRHLWLLKPLGINRVSWHDARISIRAGFIGHELPGLLGLSRDSWQIRCHTTQLGAHRMIAVRK